MLTAYRMKAYSYALHWASMGVFGLGLAMEWVSGTLVVGALGADIACLQCTIALVATANQIQHRATAAMRWVQASNSRRRRALATDLTEAQATLKGYQLRASEKAWMQSHGAHPLKRR